MKNRPDSGTTAETPAQLIEHISRLMAEAESKGHPINSLDGFIAAHAKAPALILVTHNVPDFADSVSRVLNPWRS